MEDHTRILVPVDGREGSARALKLAATLAEATGAVLEAVYVSYFADETDNPEDSWLPDSLITSAVHDEKKKAQEQIKACVPADVPVKFHHRVGVPVDEILRLADELQVDLIVVGNRGGMSLMEGFLLGSVSQGILERASTSVIVAK